MDIESFTNNRYYLLIVLYVDQTSLLTKHEVVWFILLLDL